MEVESDAESTSNPPYDSGAMALLEDKECNVVYIHSEEFERHLNKHPRLYGAVNVTHNLIKAYELLKHVAVIPPRYASVEELKSFHSEEYIEFLRKINGLSEEELLDEEEEEMEKFGIGSRTCAHQQKRANHCIEEYMRSISKGECKNLVESMEQRI